MADGELVVFRWRPKDDGSEQPLETLELPAGTYEVDLKMPPGVPSFVFERETLVSVGGRGIALERLEVITSSERRFWPDEKHGTLRFRVLEPPAPTAEQDALPKASRLAPGDRVGVEAWSQAQARNEVAVAPVVGVVLGAILRAAIGVIGVGVVLTWFVIEVRKLIKVALPTSDLGKVLLIGGGLGVAALFALKRGG